MRRPLLLATAACLLPAALAAERPTDYWSRPRRGANFFNRLETAERFRAAAAFGIEFARLAPDKWKGAGRDFLIGDASDFRGIPAADLAQVKTVLDHAHAAGVEVVLTMLSLPGARWRQHNGNRSDFRLYREPRFAEQSVAFWRELATALRGHPALVGYNLLNEPHPELASGPVNETRFDFPAFARRAEGTLQDLNGLYSRVAAAIRLADPDIPIVLDTGLYATPPAIAALRPLSDPRVLYSVHMYEPFVYTNAKQNRGRFHYPGEVPVDADEPESDRRPWDAAALARFLDPVLAWQRGHGLPAERILIGEFGVDRRAPGADRYLSDLVDLFLARGWHQAFYAFREDTWDAMDYEIGARGDNPLWRAIRRGLEHKGPRTSR